MTVDKRNGIENIVWRKLDRVDKRERLKEAMATTKGEKTFTSPKTTGHAMEHISRRHMRPVQGTSYFLSKDKTYIFALVEETMKRPDITTRHNRKRNRGVKKKTFARQVGVHGITHAPCYSVTVIYSIRNDTIISAFPTM